MVYYVIVQGVHQNTVQGAVCSYTLFLIPERPLVPITRQLGKKLAMFVHVKTLDLDADCWGLKKSQLSLVVQVQQMLHSFLDHGMQASLLGNVLQRGDGEGRIQGANARLFLLLSTLFCLLLLPLFLLLLLVVVATLSFLF